MPESATFDLVLLHYGNGEPLNCPHCRAVRGRAGRRALAVMAGPLHLPRRQLQLRLALRQTVPMCRLPPSE